MPLLGISCDGDDGASLGHLLDPAWLGGSPHRLGVQDPHAHGGLGLAQGRLKSVLQLASERSCLAPSRPMTACHTPYLCASPAHAHTLTPRR